MHTEAVKNTTGQLRILFTPPLKCHVQKNIHIRYQYLLLILYSNREGIVWHWQMLPVSWWCCFMTSLYTFTMFHSISSVLPFLCWIKEKKTISFTEKTYSTPTLYKLKEQLSVSYFSLVLIFLSLLNPCCTKSEKGYQKCTHMIHRFLKFKSRF